MATLVMPRQKVRTDDIFFPGMALLILVIVVTGFAQSYFFAGMVRAKLPNALVHIHGALFVSWILLLLVQTALVPLRRLRWHITLGTLGFVIPPLMAVFGTLTLFDSIRRNQVGIPAEILLVGDSEELLLFLILVGWAMIKRRDAATHKRLMILGALAILGPAIDRWHFGLPVTLSVALGLPMLLVGYDLWQSRKVHRCTAIGYALIATSILTLMPVAQMGVWQHVVAWIRRG